PVALGFQMIRERGPHVGVVLDDEDGRRFRPGRHCLRHQDSPGIAALRACRTAWSTLSSANGLFTQGTPVSPRNRLAPGLSVSPRDPATGTVNEKVAPCPGALPNRMEPPFPSMMP